MNKQRNRVNLTLDDDTFQLLTEFSEITGVPKATIINDLLIDVKPHMEQGLEFAKLLKQEQIKMTEVQSHFYEMVALANDEIARAVRMINEDTKNASDDGKGS